MKVNYRDYYYKYKKEFLRNSFALERSSNKALKYYLKNNNNNNIEKEKTNKIIGGSKRNFDELINTHDILVVCSYDQNDQKFMNNYRNNKPLFRRISKSETDYTKQKENIIHTLKDILNINEKDDFNITFSEILSGNIYPDYFIADTDKYKVIWFCGCNNLSVLLQNNESIDITKNILKDDGIIIFTENEKVLSFLNAEKEYYPLLSISKYDNESYITKYNKHSEDPLNHEQIKSVINNFYNNFNESNKNNFIYYTKK